MSFPPPTKQQARVLWFALTALAVATVLVLIGVLCWGLGWVLHRLSAVLLPLAIALVLAYILNPVVEYFERERMPRLWSVCLVFVLGIIVVGALLGSVIPGLAGETTKFIDDFKPNMASLHTKAEHFLHDSAVAKILPASWRNVLTPVTNAPGPVKTELRPVTPGPTTNTIVLNPTTTNSIASTNDVALDEPVGGDLMPALTHALLLGAKWLTAQLGKVTTWVEFLIGFVLVPVYLFYFLLEKDGITRRWTDYLPIKESTAKQEIVFVLSSINDCMIVFFRGQVLVALCVGVLLTIGYTVLGLNYSVLLGVVAGVLGIVPYLGTITSLILALTVAGIQFGDWTHPLIVVAIAGVVKLLEDFIISPRIIGERSGLHPLTIILAVMVGTTLLGGFLGALLAIPLTATLRTLMFRYVWNPTSATVEPEVIGEPSGPKG